MTFTLTIECDNAAFGEDTADAVQEVARLLRDTARRLDAGETDARLQDVNGNRVGEWGFNTLLNPNRRKVARG